MKMNNFIEKLINLIDNSKKTNNQFEFGDQGFNEKPPKKKKNTKTLLILPLLILVVYAVMSCQYTVEESEQAVVTTLGKVTSVETAGLHFKLPYPVQNVTKVAVNKTQKLQIGYASGSESKIDGSTVTEESKMITGDFNIVNIDFFIEWKISDPVKFLYNSDEPSHILKMISQSSARSIIGSKNVDGVLTTEKSIIQAEIKEKIINKLESYDLGVQILDVKIQDSEPPTADVIKAFKEVETAKQEKETRINEALAYKNKTLPDAESKADKLIRDAESYKESKINQASGEVARFNAMYEEYAKNKGITRTRMYLESIEEILPDITVYIDSSEGGVQKLLPLKSFSESEETTGGEQ
ncbi:MULTISPECIES: FtsH protease activity modulator HflK [unclassified Sedimentibacter]|uniref:FtsH protease activity modulator HflK n=1 Tax=unclassified Sedimentibacter TaxID=2649220 RepID=UPI0027DF799B|nr:FtsH protease activity modulator HflK [Sedimentibacter sp. MB35-C1]WMJ77648.1 FtsH protease activity modulator HflK [Sedimentibacter sp. MB35-C1]